MRPVVLIATSSLALLSADSIAQFEPDTDQEEFFLPVSVQRALPISNPTSPKRSQIVQSAIKSASSRLIQLPPLSAAELERLTASEADTPLLQKIGIDRALPEPIVLDGSVAAGPDRTLAGGSVTPGPRGGTSWTIGITSAKASSLRVTFERGRLPPGSRLFVTDGADQVFGPYALGPEPVVSNTIFGDRLFVQLQVPRGTKLSGLTILRIGHLVLPDESIAIPGGPPVANPSRIVS